LENPWIPKDPHPKQAEFLTLITPSGKVTREAFYGGAAGGGKSEALLMGAAQYAEVPGYSAVILRRTFADLAQPGAIMDRSKEWWTGTAAKWNEDKKEWRFPSGATIKFGHFENNSAKNNYMSAEYQYIAFDEATQFPYDTYRFMFSRLRRRRNLLVPLRVRAASNPGGIGHDWANQRFIIEGPENGRVFVPAKLDDNPSIEQDEYRQSLNELDPVTRAQLLEGDWSIMGSGANFRRGWFGILDEKPVQFERIVRFWDTASTAPSLNNDPDYTVGVLMGRCPDKTYVILDVQRMQGTPADVQNLVKTTAQVDAAEYGGAVETYMEQEPGASGKMMIEHYQFYVLAGYYFQGIKHTGPKVVRAASFSSMAQAKNVKIVRGKYLSAFFDELEGFPYGSHDDIVDATAGAFNRLTVGGELRPAGSLLERMFSWRN
jgi:predicted phage terminase large subunit-like protein